MIPDQAMVLIRLEQLQLQYLTAHYFQWPATLNHQAQPNLNYCFPFMITSYNYYIYKFSLYK